MTEDIFGDSDADQVEEPVEEIKQPEPSEVEDILFGDAEQTAEEPPETEREDIFAEQPAPQQPPPTDEPPGQVQQSDEQKGALAEQPEPPEAEREDIFGIDQPAPQQPPAADEPAQPAAESKAPVTAQTTAQVKKQRRATADDIKAYAAANPEDAYRRAGYLGDLKKRGNSLKGLCPFHEEKTPSFSITLTGDKAGLFFCFGCGAGGSIIDFVKQLENLPTDGEAITRSAELLPLGGAAPAARRQPTPKAAAPSKPLSVKIAQKCHDVLLAPKNEKHLRRFMQARGLSRAIIERAQIGLDGDRYTIPVFDETGRLLDIRKYLLNCPDDKPQMLAWAKGRGETHIYGWQYVKNEQTCVLAEGELDCLALVQRGIAAFSATNGAGQWPTDPLDLTGKIVYIVGDADDAGQRMNADLPPQLYTAGAAQVKIIAWPPDAPEHWDVTDFFLAGETAESFRGLMSKAETVERPDQDIEQGLAATVEAAIGTMTPQMHRTDTGNAERLVAAYGRDICYCGLWKKWLRWTGKVWEIDVEKAHIMQLGKQIAWEMYEAAWQLADEKEKAELSKWAIASETISHRTAVVTLAQSEPGIGRDPLVFDRQPWLFNCENGTIDLHTGIKREHRREDHLTKLSPVAFDPTALCPEWDKFLMDIFEGDVELVKYVQYAAGYSLTGDVRADDIFFLHGEGANGKTTLLLTLQEILGPYAIQLPPELLLKRGYRGHTTELMDLFGVRFTASVEVSEGRRFDETRLKQLSGGDRITGRRVYENDWEFKPTHKLWLAANQKPGVDSDDYAFWRRIKLIPFGVRFTPSGEPGPDINESLRESLFADERPGILNWAVQGCLGWQANGIPAPKAVKAATAEYREEEDVVGQFIEAECVVKPDARANPTDLYKAFVRWTKDTGATKFEQNAFGRRLTDKGFKLDRDAKSRWRVGIGLRIQPGLDLEK